MRSKEEEHEEHEDEHILSSDRSNDFGSKKRGTSVQFHLSTGWIVRGVAARRVERVERSRRCVCVSYFRCIAPTVSTRSTHRLNMVEPFRILCKSTQNKLNLTPAIELEQNHTKSYPPPARFVLLLFHESGWLTPIVRIDFVNKIVVLSEVCSTSSATMTKLRAQRSYCGSSYYLCH